MKMLNVFLACTSENRILIGQLAKDNKNRIYFEYDGDFITRNINISPFKLDFRTGLQSCDKAFLGNIHGVFNDSLPDGWGLLLMDRYFKKAGFDLREISHLERLSFLGNRTIGALTYEPVMDVKYEGNLIVDLYKLSINSMDILKGKEKDILPVMLKAGGSPGGARPKILVGYNGKELISGEAELPDGFEPWIIKFRSEKDFKDASKIEFVYMKMAELAGLIVPEVKLFQDNKNHYYFGCKRFDRNNNDRIHFHSFGNLIHADFRVPSVDYEMLFKVCSKLTHNFEAVKLCFKIMIFNILSCNRDDHVKNFGFLMSKDGAWSFSPSFDLMFSLGIGGEHSMTVAGEGKNPSIHEIDYITKIFQISEKDKKEIINSVRNAVNKFEKLSKALDISTKEIELIKSYHKKIAKESGLIKLK
ncbi:MAG: type II toxin-antitoxin system HipA family toxin [Pseudomonadota bacterium]